MTGRLIEIRLPQDEAKLELIKKALLNPVNNIMDFWGLLSAYFHSTTQQTFRLNGGRAGNPRWPTPAYRTVATKVGTFNIRRGSDGTPKPLAPEALKELRRKWGWAHRGYMRKGVRRWGAGSKLLQASGWFRNSFGTLWRTPKGISFGTNYELAEKIMSVRNRQVLFLMPLDYTNIRNAWYNHVTKRLKP